MTKKRNFENWQLGFWNGETGEFVALDDLTVEEVREFYGVPGWSEALDLVVVGLTALGEVKVEVKKRAP